MNASGKVQDRSMQHINEFGYLKQSKVLTHNSELLMRTQCEYFRFIENPHDESIIIFQSCSTNFRIDTNLDNPFVYCPEHHTGNVPRSIMTKGTSTSPNIHPYHNFNLGNQDKLMVSYHREPNLDYTNWFQ